jgi:transposase
MVEEILYRFRAGIPWRDLPENFGPWQTVWKRHRRFIGDGARDRILTELLSQADSVGLIEWEVSVTFAGPGTQRSWRCSSGRRQQAAR